jgi:site-specific DNA recombinase
MKKCGLVIRVSTEGKGAESGNSLTDQLRRLKEHLKCKTEATGEPWVEAGRYVLKGVSGKNSLRSKEFAKLFEDVKTGRINTVMCTALDRISRSVNELLNFSEFLSQHRVEFVCLKQSFDTTTPQGKLLTAVMAALAEFEREQMCERMRKAKRARGTEN